MLIVTGQRDTLPLAWEYIFVVARSFYCGVVANAVVGFYEDLFFYFPPPLAAYIALQCLSYKEESCCFLVSYLIPQSYTRVSRVRNINGRVYVPLMSHLSLSRLIQHIVVLMLWCNKKNSATPPPPNGVGVGAEAPP